VVSKGQCGRPRRLWAHREGTRPGCTQRLRQIGKLAQQRAGVAGVDDLLNREGFRRPERGAQRIEPSLDLGKFGLGIGSRLNVGAVSSFDATL
jgi:hypothetical protein